MDVEEIRRRIENLAERMEQDFTAEMHDRSRTKTDMYETALAWVAAFRTEARSKFKAPMVWE